MNPPERKKGDYIRRDIASLDICVVTHQFLNVLSGPGVYARNIIKHLIGDGHRVTLLTLENEKPEQIDGFQFCGIHHKVFLKNHARWIELSPFFNRALKALEEYNSFDLIHFVDIRDAYFCKTKAAMVGNINDTYTAYLQPLSYYFKNYRDWLMRWGYYWLVHKLEKLYLAKIDVIIANSLYTAQTLRDAYPGTAKKIFTIYKSIDSKHFLETFSIRKSMNWPNNPTILMVGSNLQRKGIRTIIHAAAEILRRIPNCFFKIAGGDSGIPSFKRLCVQLGVADHVIFLGHQTRDQLKSLYAEASVFILPAITEAFGLTILEAMASGVPVIGTNVGGIPEIIQDGINGLLIPPNSPSALAQAIHFLLQNHEMRYKFSQFGIETAQNFNVDNMMNETYRVYAQIINNGVSSENKIGMVKFGKTNIC